MKFNGQKLTDVAFIPIAEIIINSSDDEKIDVDLSSNLLTSASNDLLRTIVSKKNLRSLNLRNNKFDQLTWEMLGYALSSSQLEELDISNNDLQDVGLGLLFKNIDQQQTLHTLNISNTKISDTAAIFIANWIKTKPVRKLNLFYNNIHAIGLKQIAQALQINRTITFFNIGSNYIGTDGAECLAQAIASHPSLEELGLYAVGLENKGAISISRALATNVVIKQLHMGANKIGDPATLHIILLITKNKSLIKLDLSENNFQHTGSQFAFAIQINQKITLELHSNQFTSSTLDLFKDNFHRVSTQYNDVGITPLMKPIDSTPVASSSASSSSSSSASSSATVARSFVAKEITHKEKTIYPLEEGATIVQTTAMNSLPREKTIYPANEDEIYLNPKGKKIHPQSAAKTPNKK